MVINGTKDGMLFHIEETVIEIAGFLLLIKFIIDFVLFFMDEYEMWTQVSNPPEGELTRASAYALYIVCFKGVLDIVYDAWKADQEPAVVEKGSFRESEQSVVDFEEACLGPQDVADTTPYVHLDNTGVCNNADSSARNGADRSDTVACAADVLMVPPQNAAYSGAPPPYSPPE